MLGGHDIGVTGGTSQFRIDVEAVSLGAELDHIRHLVDVVERREPMVDDIHASVLDGLNDVYVLATLRQLYESSPRGRWGLWALERDVVGWQLFSRGTVEIHLCRRTASN